MKARDRGVITCIRVKDTGQALALARSLRLHSPGVPSAVVVEGEGLLLARSLRRLEACFDHVTVLEDRHARMGWQVKNVMDAYSPFDRSLFLDADCLVVRPLDPVFARFEGRTVSFSAKVRCEQEKGSALYASVSLERLLADFRLAWWPQIEGGGHFYWERGDEATRLFAAARSWAEPGRLASTGYRGPGVPDELTLQLAMAEAGLAETLPVRGLGFMCWQPSSHTQVEALSGRLWNPGDPEDRDGLLRDSRVIHFGGVHHSRLYLRERRRLGVAWAFGEIAARERLILQRLVDAVSRVEDLGKRCLGRFSRLVSG